MKVWFKTIYVLHEMGFTLFTACTHFEKRSFFFCAVGKRWKLKPTVFSGLFLQLTTAQITIFCFFYGILLNVFVSFRATFYGRYDVTSVYTTESYEQFWELPEIYLYFYWLVTTLNSIILIYVYFFQDMYFYCVQIFVWKCYVSTWNHCNFTKTFDVFVQNWFYAQIFHLSIYIVVLTQTSKIKVIEKRPNKEFCISFDIKLIDNESDRDTTWLIEYKWSVFQYPISKAFV